MQDTCGALDVNLDLVDLDREQPAYGMTLKPGSYVRLSVQDTGCGIAPEVMERIFEPYFTTKETGQGTGLGLALVLSIVQACGGGITVLSLPSQGTTFQVYLPRVGANDLQEMEVTGPGPAGHGNILLVDDEADIVGATRILLEQSGYRVTSFTDSREALMTFKAAPEKFDLVITDLTMPHLTGLELAQALLQIRPGLPILLCTGYGEPTTVHKARGLGIQEVMLKPIIPQQLAVTLRGMLDGRKP